MDETEATVREYVDACNSNDLDRVLAMLHPDVEFHESASLPGPVSAVGYEAVARYLQHFETHWSDFHWEPLEFHVSGQRALMRARLRLRGRKSGIDVDREWLYVFSVRDGRLVRQDGYDDIAGAREALEAAEA
jgi:ketosteroid isomerase-like protein